MKKNKAKYLGLISLTALSLVSVVIAQTYMIFVATKNYINDNNNTAGEVGLRQYFDSGEGTSTSPFVITRPRHLYNLSRLQALGAFSSKKYFQLGKLDGSGAYKVYGTDAGITLDKTVLDMDPKLSGINSIISIGSSATPFFGEFQGNNLVIDNLTIDSAPEDIGMFGYVASSAIVQNFSLSNVVITDNGYVNQMSDLFTADYSGDSHNLINYGGTEITSVSQSFSDTTLAFTINDKINALKDTFGSNVTFSTSVTNASLFNIASNGDITLNTTPLLNNADFISSNSYISQRIYLKATKTVDFVDYSKIINTYLITIKNSIVNEESVLSIDVVKEPDETYNYTHNTNIGFIAGHSDGTVKDSYVYKGSFSFNNNGTGRELPAESEIGLIGEVGVNINSSFTPTNNYQSNKDTGIINFTSIYNNIAPSTSSSFTYTSFTTTSSTTYNYYYFTPKEGNYFNEYLRKRLSGTSTYEYVTDKALSVDFAGQQTIVEDEDGNRGIGIFQLNTSEKEADVNDNFAQGLGEFSVVQDASNAYSNIYYTTSELDATQKGTMTPTNFYNTYNLSLTDNDKDWSTDSSTGTFTIVQGTSINNNSLTSYFDHAVLQNLLSSGVFERNFNYVFKLSLSASLSTNYFNNTNCAFLEDYFTYKLRDSDGRPIKKNDTQFGLMIQEKSGDDFVNTESFNSYLNIAQYTKSTLKSFPKDGKTYPSKTIEFSIKNDNGANITLIGKNVNENGGYLGIYDKQYLGVDLDLYKHPSYVMYLPSYKDNNTNTRKNGFYFDYDNATGNLTSYNATRNNAEQSRLYAHTFFLPKGEYFIGSPENDAVIYYIAAQGQNGEGDVGGSTKVFLDEVIENLDFLLFDPSQSTTKQRAYLSFYATFDNTQGQFLIGCGGKGTDADPYYLTLKYYENAGDEENLTSALIYNQHKQKIVFQNDDPTTERYVAYNYNI